MSEAASANNWTKAATTLADAKAAWTTLRPQVAAAGGSPATLAAIDDALTKYEAALPAKNVRVAATEANRISRLVPDLFDLYIFPIPAEALRLDAQIRLLQIDAGFADWAACATDLGTVRDTWARLRPKTAERASTRADLMGATTVAADLDANLSALAGALSSKNAAALAIMTKQGLDLVDVIEQAFE